MLSTFKWERYRQKFIAIITLLPVPEDDEDNGLDDIAPIFEDRIKQTEDAEKLLIEGVNDSAAGFRSKQQLSGQRHLHRDIS